MPDTDGVISVGNKMILRDEAQGALRRRELAKGQKLSIVVHNDDAVVIKKSLDLPQDQNLEYDDVTRYLWKQQLERIGEENFVSASHKMEAQVQRPILQLMKDAKQNPKEIAKLFKQSRNSFSKTPATILSLSMQKRGS